jgi:hypothetical protein
MNQTAAQTYRESIFGKLLRIPRDILIIFLVAIVLIEAIALSVFISQPNLLTKLGEKVVSFPNEEQNNRWRSYQNQKLGFEFMYPPEITEDTSDHPGIISRFVLLETPTGKNEPVDSMLISLEVSPYQTRQDAASFIASFFQNDSVSVSSEEKIIGTSIPTSMVTIKQDSTAPAETTYAFVQLAGGEILEIQMFWTGKSLGRYEQIANQILSTLKLID